MCGPSITIDVGAKGLWEVVRNDPSEPQGADREQCAERSGRKTCGATNRDRIGGAGSAGI